MTVVVKKLSEGQKKFFKDSKVRDESGKLLVTYHGSPNDFTVFDTSKIGSITGAIYMVMVFILQQENQVLKVMVIIYIKPI